jgi:hypothetical protein
MLLPHYQFEAETGVWINREEKESRVRSWLGQIDYSNGLMEYKSHQQVKSHQPSSSFIQDRSRVKLLSAYLEEAKDTLVRVVENYKNLYGKSELDQRKLIGEQYQKLVWFMFPSEVLGELLNLRHQSPLSFEALAKFNDSRNALEINPTASAFKAPFKPLDFNHGQTHLFKFSDEYLAHHNKDVS